MTTGPSMRALELFEQLAELEGETRAAALEEACVGDDGLRAEVERMLAVESHADFLDAESVGATRPERSFHAERAGTTIGPFTIVRTLGSGGMGVVYEAEQRVPERRVALKTLATGVVRPSAERRFHSEVQLLARLDHPAIARVLEAGTALTAEGTNVPYFAMEYVDDARDLVSWAEGRELRDRVELMEVVCRAIQHGHQQGVIHRDLKPANVLVDRNDAPKVIDFGVARAIDGTGESAPNATRTGEIVGTLRYMAPEQIDGSAQVDTRTDVYALGLLLYEAIAGEPPYDLEDLTLTEIARVIREMPPRPLGRSNEPVPEDLGWIAMRALEKEPARRYPSASELAADLRRFIDDVPVEAGRPSRTYALKKLVRRHRTVSLSIAAVVLAVLIGAAVSFAAMLRANDEAAKARAINEVLAGMLTGVRVEEGGADIRAVELLDRASEQVEGLGSRSSLRAPLHLTLARSYRSLSLHREAAREARRALALGAALSPADRVEAALELAESLANLDRWDEARALVDEWTVDPSFETAEPWVQLALRRVGHEITLEQGDAAKAAAGYAAILAESREKLGPMDPGTIKTEGHLANALIFANRHDEAVALMRARIEAGESSLPTALLDARFLLTRAMAGQGRHEVARDLLEELVPEIRATFGEDHSRTRVAMGGLAAAYLRTGAAARAAPIMEEVALAWERREGPDHSETLTARGNHAQALAELGDVRAEDLLRDTYEAKQRVFGAHDLRTTTALFKWARMLRKEGRMAEAEPLLVDLVARSEASMSVQRPERHRYASELGLLYLQSGRPEEASDRFAAAWGGMARTAGARHADTLTIGMNFGSSLLESGLWDEAIDVYIELLADARDVFDEGDRRICILLNNLGGAYVQSGELHLAVARFADALEWANRHRPSDHPERLGALDTLGTRLVEAGRPGDALPHFEELVAESELNPAVDAKTRSAFRLGYARCLLATDRLDESAEEFATVVEMEHARLGGQSTAAFAALEEEFHGVLDLLDD
ncbi:MAG: tetratricopeptide repeat protein [Planctomycetota bacterium]